jgi:hypothetical protein
MSQKSFYWEAGEIADRVRNTALGIKMPCQECSAKNAKPYVFVYAKTLSRKSETVTHRRTRTTTTTTTYGDINARAVYLCLNCIDRNKHQLTIIGWFVFSFLTLLLTALIIAAIFVTGKLKILIAFLAFFTGIITLGCLVALLRPTPEGFDGAAMALQLNKEKLKEEGYDVFWYPEAGKDLLH